MSRFHAGDEVAYRAEGATAPDDFEVVDVIDRIDEGVYKVRDENGLTFDASVTELHVIEGKGEEEIEAYFKAQGEALAKVQEHPSQKVKWTGGHRPDCSCEWCKAAWVEDDDEEAEAAASCGGCENGECDGCGLYPCCAKVQAPATVLKLGGTMREIPLVRTENGLQAVGE